jgi:hypothetical protein
MKDFTELDNAILAYVDEAGHRFASINSAVEKLAAPLGKGDHDTYRVVDRRLQSLRKRGLIRFGTTKWFRVTVDRTRAQE